MDSALAWIGQIAEWIGKFIPRWLILDTTEGAVKYVRGKNTVALGPGVHWYWPLLTKVTEFPTARQADRLQAQTVVTTDDKTVIVAGMIVYEVVDIVALVAQNYRAADTIKDIALTAVHDVCCQQTWESLKYEQRRSTLDTKLKNAAQKQLEGYGVRVIKLMLIDLAPARVVRLSQTTSTEEN